MSRFRTVGCHLLTLAIFSLAGASSSWANVSLCREIFEGSQWPPKSWSEFLEKSQLHRASSLQSPIPSNVINSPALDARLYQMHLLPGTIKHGPTEGVSVRIATETSAIPNAQFRFLYSAANSFLPLSYVFQPVEGGPTFSITRLPGRRQFSSEREYGNEFNSYLSKVYKVVTSNQHNQELNDYFTQVERSNQMMQTSRETGIFRESRSSREAEANRFGMDLRVENEIVPEGQVTKHPIQVFNSGEILYATRSTVKRGNLIISVIDTQLEVPRAGMAIGSRPTEADITIGLEQQRNWVDEILTVIYPEYAERRKWSQSFIEHDYQSVLSSLNSTRYISVARVEENNTPGEIVAAIGLNRAAYGTEERFNSESGQWEEHLGGFGRTFWEDHPDARTSYQPAIDTNVPLLKMEAYLNIRLKRPSSITNVDWSHQYTSLYRDAYSAAVPRFQGMGVIYEPVKFYLASKNTLSRSAQTELVAAMVDSIFPKYRSLKFGLTSQYLYTFNPLREGQLLYSKRGYKALTDYQSVLKDGQEWHVFGETPDEFLHRFHSLSPEDLETEAGNFIRSMQLTATTLADTQNLQAQHH